MMFKWFLLIVCFAVASVEASVEQAVQRLKIRARESNSEAVLVVRNGKPAVDFHKGCEYPRLACYELDRPVLALAFGFLSDERYITSLDVPLSSFSKGEQSSSDFTLRALLASENDDFYCLGQVVKSITGLEWHEYIQGKLLTPLGISNACWFEDICGRIRLKMSAPELAKIGQLLLCNGQHRGKQLLSRQWITLLQKPATELHPFMSLQWYLEYFDMSVYWDNTLLNLYRQQGLCHSSIHMLSDLNGRVVHFGGLAVRGHFIHGWGQDVFCSLGGQEGLSRLIAETYQHGVPFGHFYGGGIKSFVAWGTGGQQLIIMPSRNVVAVRQTSCLGTPDRFEDFIEVVDAYVQSVDCFID